MEVPVGEPGGGAGIPPFTESQQLSGSSGGFSSSENFRGYGGATFVFGGRASGDRYQMVSREMGIGQQRVGGGP